ncbi:MAG TPA: hypothetical protein VK137_02850, partial [Planctomycetaceae bacterium]|nr:hypothetical protein [Planctomycetaceae bacterium]
GLRMMTVLLGALVIHQTRADLGLREFFSWLIVFYSVTLLVETLLLLDGRTRSGVFFRSAIRSEVTRDAGSPT